VNGFSTRIPEELRQNFLKPDVAYPDIVRLVGGEGRGLSAPFTDLEVKIISTC